MLLKLKILFFFLAISFSTVKAQEVLDQEMGEALKTLSASTTIVLADGIWKDSEFLVKGKGIDEQSITLTFENLNKVSLEGKSNLKIAGSYIIVEGLFFKNDHTPTSEVISYKRNNDDQCNNCRDTECVIDNYNPAKRFDSHYWVGMYGKNNRFEHNYLTEKMNSVAAIALRLNTEESKANTRPHIY